MKEFTSYCVHWHTDRQTDQGVLYCCGHDIPTINIIPASLYVHLAYHLALCVIMTCVLNKF